MTYYDQFITLARTLIDEITSRNVTSEERKLIISVLDQVYHPSSPDIISKLTYLGVVVVMVRAAMGLPIKVSDHNGDDVVLQPVWSETVIANAVHCVDVITKARHATFSQRLVSYFKVFPQREYYELPISVRLNISAHLPQMLKALYGPAYEGVYNQETMYTHLSLLQLHPMTRVSDTYPCWRSDILVELENALLGFETLAMKEQCQRDALNAAAVRAADALKCAPYEQFKHLVKQLIPPNYKFVDLPEFARAHLARHIDTIMSAIYGDKWLSYGLGNLASLKYKYELLVSLGIDQNERHWIPAGELRDARPIWTAATLTIITPLLNKIITALSPEYEPDRTAALEAQLAALKTQHP